MPNDALSKIRREAKRIIKDHPNMKYQSALKKAGHEYKQGKIGKRKAAKSRHARKVGTHYKVYHEVRKVGNVADTERQLRAQLEEKLAWAMLAKECAKNVSERKKAAKQIAEIKKKFRAVGGLKR